jgi:hypothetical protein
MLSFASGFIASLLVTLFIVRYAHLHEKFSVDSDLAGVQKFHVRPVPRVGGIGILAGVVIAALILSRRYPTIAGSILGIAACGMPAFLSGLVEDLTKRVSPRARLLCTMGAAALAFWLLGIAVKRISVPPLDFLLGYVAISAFITVLAVAALANAINIIDGFNGLASMVSFMMFASLAYVAFHVNDPVVMSASIIMMGAVLGFFLEFPGRVDLSRRRRRLFHRVHAGGARDHARDAQSRGVGVVPGAAVHVSDLRDVLLDLPEEVHPRDVAGDSGRRASAHARVQAADAVGGRDQACA